MNEVTRILSAVEQGDARAAEQLLPLVYGELRKLAVHMMAQEKPGQTLQGTALVHEAYVRLVGDAGGTGTRQWDGRRHFFAAAAEAMRRILVEAARSRGRLKRGGGQRRVDLDALELSAELTAIHPADDLLAVDAALEKLADNHPEKAQLVKMRYFAGLTIEQAAQALGVSIPTANRHWAFARAWLYHHISAAGSPGGD